MTQLEAQIYDILSSPDINDVGGRVDAVNKIVQLVIRKRADLHEDSIALMCRTLKECGEEQAADVIWAKRGMFGGLWLENALAKSS